MCYNDGKTLNFDIDFNLLFISWLQSFLDRLLIKVIAKINASRKNQEEKKAMKSEIEKRLKTLECETENVSNRGVPNGKTCTKRHLL